MIKHAWLGRLNGFFLTYVACVNLETIILLLVLHAELCRDTISGLLMSRRKTFEIDNKPARHLVEIYKLTSAEVHRGSLSIQFHTTFTHNSH